MSDTESPGHPSSGPGGPEGRDALAGEYVLGTLNDAERREFEAELARDPGLRTAVAAWANRLQPLADSTPPVAPPPGLRQRVLDGLKGKVVPMKASRAKRMVSWTLGLSALGAVAAALIVALIMPKAPDIGGYAMLRDQTGKPALAFQVDHAHKELIVQATMPEAGAGHDYELWIIPAGGAPKSLGVVPAAARDERAIPPEISPLVAEGATLAISLEPAGGSKTGAPTGPVLFTGTLELADAAN